MISPKNPGFLSPVVMANSEPSAQLAGSPTTACFSFCSSLGLAGTEGIPVPGQANSTTCLCAEPAWGHTRCHSTNPATAALSLAPLRSQHSSPCVPAKLPRSCLAVLCHAWPAPLTVALGTVRETRGAWQGKGGTHRVCWEQHSSPPLWKKGNHTVPGCSTLAKDRGRGHQGGQEAPTPGRARGGGTGEVALRWGRAQGWRRGADDPWGCECQCLTVGCWVSGQPFPQLVHYPAHEHVQLRHLSQKQPLILLIPGCGIGVHRRHSVGHFFPPPTEQHFGS